MSASQKITLELTVAEAQAIAKLRAFDSMLSKMGGSLKQVGADGGTAGNKLNSGFAAVQGSVNRAVKAFLSLNMGLRAMHTLVTAIRTELDRMKQYRASAAEQEIEYSRQLKEFKMRMPAGDTMSLAAIDAIVKAEAGSVPKNEIMGHVLKSLSAGSNMSTRERIRTGVEMARVLQPFPQSEKEEVGGAIQRMRENYGVTPTEAAGMFVQTMQSSTLTNPREVTQNIISPANQLKSLGFSLEQGLELMAGAQMATEDPHGRMSRTMMLANLNRIYEQYKDVVPNLRGMDIFDFSKAQGRFGPGTEFHKLALSANKKLQGGLDEEMKKVAEQFKNDPEYAVGEAGDLLSRGAIRTRAKSIFALSPESGGPALDSVEQAAYAEMQAARRQIQSPKDAAATLMKRLEAEPESTPYDVSTTLTKLDEKLKESSAAAIGGELDKLMENITIKIGRHGAWGKDWLMQYRALARTSGVDGEKRAIEGTIATLRGLKQEVATGTETFSGTRFMAGAGGAGTPLGISRDRTRTELSPAEQKRSDDLQWAIDQLVAKLDELGRQAAGNGINQNGNRPIPVEVTNQPPAQPPVPQNVPVTGGGF
jgi:hypothetical protein